MEIQEKLLKFKFHIIVTVILLALVFSLVILAPSFLTILAYFWPLFLSTALFLVAVIFFGKTSVPATDSHGDHHKAAAEGLLDYVAGQPVEDHVQQQAEAAGQPAEDHVQQQAEPVAESLNTE